MLELSGFAFGRGAFAALMAALLPNGRLHGLQKMRLDRIDSAMVAEIAQMLRSNTSIKELDTYFNPIGDEGAILLADALLDNKTETLSLYV
jgi:hypothetical protein